MKTYDKLKAGKLAGATELRLLDDFETFPSEIINLADSLEVLELSAGRLSDLPSDFGKLKKLRILFLSNNLFTKIPSVLAQCPELTMIGLKSNQISDFPENALPPKLRWLILTDNQIEKLPESIGELHKLQKLMLAGNRIVTLPESMAKCENLELIRLSANRLEELPEWLFTMPRLSWLACAGNPCMPIPVPGSNELAEIAWEEVLLHEELGKGASGVISRASIRDETDVAIKIFRGEVTSDGYPADEMSVSIVAGKHDNLNTPHGKITNHPDKKQALLFPLIPSIYCNLGNPPSLESCTRDTYDDEARFSLPLLLRIASDIISATLHLHQRGVNHGDLYAHNILIDREGHSLLGDFGAATCYDHALYGNAFEQLEVRAFGCLLEDLLDRYSAEDMEEEEEIKSLERLKEECLHSSVVKRPPLKKILRSLK